MLILATSMTIFASSIVKIESQSSSIDVLDSTTILLDNKKIDAGDYIILYSTGDKIITLGNLAMKLPCDMNSEPKDWMLIGGVGSNLATFQPIGVQLAQGNPGNMCAYSADIPGESEMSVIVLVNSGSDGLRFPRTASIVITVHSVAVR